MRAVRSRRRALLDMDQCDHIYAREDDLHAADTSGPKHPCGLPLLPKNRPATSTRSAVAKVLTLQGRRMPLRKLDVVVVHQLFAWADRFDALDEDAIAFAHRLAIGGAGMIDPAARVAADIGIDHALVIDLEEECMVLPIAFVIGVSAVHGRPGDDLTLVFDDACAFRYRL